MAVIEPLRLFQEEDVPFFLSHPKSLILYEPRLGKTVVSCNVLALDPKTSSVLIACSKNAMSVWIDHIKVWFNHLIPDKKVDFRIIRGKGGNSALQRQEEWTRPREADTITVYLVTFAALLIDWPFLQQKKLTTFDTIIGDEVHRVLRSHKTKTSGMFRWLVKNCRRCHLLSGTMVSKWGPADYFAALQVLNGYEFSSYWKYVNTWCITFQGMWGMEIVGPKNREQFHRMMSRYCRMRDRATYGPQMPSIVRDRIYFDLDSKIRALYDQIGREKFAITPNGNVVVARNSLEKFARKRQLVTCPAIIDPTLGVGAAFEYVLGHLEEAKEDDDQLSQHIVIFTSLRKAIPHFTAALVAAGYRDVFTLAGGTEPEDLVRITNDFTRTKGIMLCTTQFAQAFSLSSSRICFHIGWSYDPNENKQAEDRLVAQQGDYSINSWYMSATNTDDDDLGEAVIAKNRTITLTNRDPSLDPEPFMSSE